CRIGRTFSDRPPVAHLSVLPLLEEAPRAEDVREPDVVFVLDRNKEEASVELSPRLGQPSRDMNAECALVALELELHERTRRAIQVVVLKAARLHGAHFPFRRDGAERSLASCAEAA